jgi:hypothetical protein
MGAGGSKNMLQGENRRKVHARQPHPSLEGGSNNNNPSSSPRHSSTTITHSLLQKKNSMNLLIGTTNTLGQLGHNENNKPSRRSSWNTSRDMNIMDQSSSDQNILSERVHPKSSLWEAPIHSKHLIQQQITPSKNKLFQDDKDVNIIPNKNNVNRNHHHPKISSTFTVAAVNPDRNIRNIVISPDSDEDTSFSFQHNPSMYTSADFLAKKKAIDAHNAQVIVYLTCVYTITCIYTNTVLLLVGRRS